MPEIVMVCGKRTNGRIERVHVFDPSEVESIREDLARDPDITEVWTVEGEHIGYMNLFTGEITRP